MDTSSDAALEKYLTAWDALGTMLAQGRSLSGRERNCCFLNTGQPKFADVSAVTGFDFDDDTRGVALTDWDHDGDLDIWMTNRTAPRIRFLQNNYASGQNFLQLKLQGVESNRDAIGARVELELGAGNGKLVRVLRAGEGYLSQSSKWLHFGLGKTADIDRAFVFWPSGRREAFAVKANARYTLVEGSGEAVRASPRESGPSRVAHADQHTGPASNPASSSLASSSPASSSPATSSDVARIVLPARLPLPQLAYRDFDGSDVTLSPNTQGPLLINLWATWCQPCLQELAEWSRRQAEFRDAGVNIVLVCVDEATEAKSVDKASVQQLLRRLEIPFASGLATPDLLDALDITQQVLTKRLRPMPVPTSFLIDNQGRLAVVYKGPATAEQLLRDIGNLSLPPEKHRELAVAFPGIWYTNPFRADLLAIPKKYQSLDQPEKALAYMLRHATPTSFDSTSPQADTLVENAAEVYVELARALQAQDNSALVIQALQAAAELQPHDTKPGLALAMIFQQSGRAGDAASAYRMILENNPGDPLTSNNLAWLLATSADPAVRNPAEAVRLAETVVTKSHRKLPSALDTLAAAYAAAKRFDDAVATIDEAIALSANSGQEAGLRLMRDRRERYLENKAIIEP